MIIRFEKKEDGKLAPLYAKDKTAFDLMREKLKTGERIVFDTRTDRNKKHHDKYHALLDWSLDNSDKLKAQFQSHDNLHFALKFAFCEQHRQDLWITCSDMKGKAIMRPFSEAIHEMKQADFDQFYKFAIETIATIIGVEPVAIDAELYDYQ